MKSKTMARNLQIAAFTVAIFRYMAMGGMAIGHDMFKTTLAGFSIFIAFEVVSWGAMAVLEGFALPFISRGMKQFPTNSFYWKQLLAYRIILLLAIPLLGAPLYAAVSRNSTIDAQLHPALYWAWLFLFSGLVALIVDGVGIVDEIEEKKAEVTGPTEAELKTEAWGILAQAHSKGTWIYPPTLVSLMRGKVDEAKAVRYLSEWYESVPKKPGVKSKEEQGLIEFIQPGGLMADPADIPVTTGGQNGNHRKAG